jgi:hypothetical protein
MFLYQAIRLASRGFTPTMDLLLALGVLAALCAWIGLRTFMHAHDLRDNKARVYRCLWNGLEQVYRELRDGGTSAIVVRRHWHQVYRYFLRYGRVIGAGDRIVFRDYIVALQRLRFAKAHDTSAWEMGPCPTLSGVAMSCAAQTLSTSRLRNAAWQRVCRIVPADESRQVAKADAASVPLPRLQVGERDWTLQQSSSEKDQADAEIDDEASHIDQRSHEWRRRGRWIEADPSKQEGEHRPSERTP